MLAINWFKYSAPTTFYGLAGKLVPWFAGASAILFVAGLYIGFFVAPTDAVQSEAYRIIFIHVPTSILSMFIYLVMAGYAALGLIFNTRLSSMMATALAPTGALFTFIALWTGAFWGKPMWGAWWVWDARLTSMLILFFLYLGYIALWEAFDDPGRAGRAAAILALVGAINLPVIKFSVDWWNTLHQPSSVLTMEGSKIDPSILWPLLVTAIGAEGYYVWMLCLRVRAEILDRQARILRFSAAADRRAG